MKAVILLGVGLGSEDRLKRTVEKFEGVRDAFVVYGEHDVVLLVDVPDQEALNRMVSKIRRVEGVARTITLVAAES